MAYFKEKELFLFAVNGKFEANKYFFPSTPFFYFLGKKFIIQVL